jgi:hypothetical protein
LGDREIAKEAPANLVAEINGKDEIERREHDRF